VLLVIGLVAAAGLSACGSGGSTGAGGGGASAGGSSNTLRLAFDAEPMPPDPATFYENEGLNVIDAVYQGLIRFTPNTTVPKIEGVLAKSWTVSQDGLTYSFTLQSGLKFADGTPLNSQAVKFSFQRFAAMKGGPSYMVGDVRSYETPSPTTFIIKLSKPFGPFLDLLAGPYGPKAVSPTLIKAHEVNGDHAGAWMKTHSAGSGPYVISSWQPGHFQLRANANFSGSQPAFAHVDITVIPNFTTQQLDLQQGSLDILIAGVQPRDLSRLKAQGEQVFLFDQAINNTLYVNTGVPPFSVPAVRQALATGIDRASIVQQSYVGTGTLSKTVAPGPDFPPGTVTYDPAYNPAALKRAVAALPASNKTVTVAYASQDAVNQQIADVIQTELSAAGLNATTRAVPLQQLFSWPAKPNLRANLLLIQANADTSSPWAWDSLFLYHGGGLSWMNPTVCGSADAMATHGVGLPDQAAAMSDYKTADRGYQSCGAFVPLANTKGIVVTRKGLTGIEHPFNDQTAILLGEVRPG
jgi:peptide/nickel transport system substrate-binding protein